MSGPSAQRWVQRRRAWRLAVTSALSLASAGCASHASYANAHLIPSDAITTQALDAAVDGAVVVGLVGFAARDRQCAQISRGRGSGLHEPYEPYIECMWQAQIDGCGATADDLRTVRTLLDRDPRLAAIMGFGQVLARWQSTCAGQRGANAAASVVQAWRPRDLLVCEDRYQPVLITAAIMLRTVPPRDEEKRFLWSAECRGTAGYFFLERHCREMRRAEQRERSARPRARELGIEPYFCPQIQKHFAS